jgi:hypothetical protein
MRVWVYVRMLACVYYVWVCARMLACVYYLAQPHTLLSFFKVFLSFVKFFLHMWRTECRTGGQGRQGKPGNT